MEETSERHVYFYVDTLDGNQIPIQAETTISIVDLKQKILDLTEIPSEKLRLIYKGKYMKDSESLTGINITTRVQLVANLTEPDDLISMISQYNFLRTLRVYRRLSRISRPVLSQRYLYEALRQSSITIDDMIRIKSDRGFLIENRILQANQ